MKRPCRVLSFHSSNEDIQQFYSQYVSAFVSGDMKTISTEFYHAPVSISMCVYSNTIMRSTFHTAVDIEQALTFQMEGLIARGYAGKSDMEPVSIIPMTAVSKLLQSEGTRYHVSGAVLEKIRASYVIERIIDDSTYSGRNRPDSSSDSGGDTDGYRSMNPKSHGERWHITAIYGEITPMME